MPTCDLNLTVCLLATSHLTTNYLIGTLDEASMAACLQAELKELLGVICQPCCGVTSAKCHPTCSHQLEAAFLPALDHLADLRPWFARGR